MLNNSLRISKYLYFSVPSTERPAGGSGPDLAMAEELVKYAVMVERVLGYLFLAHLVVVLARKIIR